ncbi:hypothetical protein GOODEAATRI_027059 [Goodea atripinnis]|uniref:Uncharacterized protein n=1 Tax=Goodea atripinnis TaxID=208336 RepID=A0ABV0PHJ0_9TELE
MFPVVLDLICTHCSRDFDPLLHTAPLQNPYSQRTPESSQRSPNSLRLRVIQLAAESNSEQRGDGKADLSEEVCWSPLLGVTLFSNSCDWLLKNKETKLKNKCAPRREINR